MKKILLIIALVMVCSSCSFLPKLISPPNTVPQDTTKNSKVEKCPGVYQADSNGVMVCSQGYVSNEQNYSKKERSMTFKEKIVSWINQFFGWFIFGVILFTIFAPGLMIHIFTNIINQHKKVIEQTVKGIEDAKKPGGILSTSLGLNQDTDVQVFIKDLKHKLGL
jgi:hypothetical protein